MPAGAALAPLFWLRTRFRRQAEWGTKGSKPRLNCGNFVRFIDVSSRDRRWILIKRPYMLVNLEPKKLRLWRQFEWIGGSTKKVC